MSLTQYDPLANFPATFRSFEDAISRMLSEPRGARPWSPAVDIYETENELVLHADLPDVKLEEIEVRVENQTLTIKGERKFEKKESARGYHRIERNYGVFTRSFTLTRPQSIPKRWRRNTRTVSFPSRCPKKRRPSRVR